MTPVHQTIFGTDGAEPHERGNCFSAAIASLLDLPLADVPHFVAEEDWWGAFSTWLQGRGLFAVEFSTPPNAPDGSLTVCPAGNFYAIGAGPSPRGEFLHSVVIRIDADGVHYAHDPHPSGDFLKRLTHIKVLVPGVVGAAPAAALALGLLASGCGRGAE